MHRKLLVFAIVGAALCNPALAQAASATDAIPEKAAPGANVPDTDLSKQSGNLSDKLNKTNGVIHPDGGVDPKMQKPAPATGAMSVIPPPGDPGVQPK